MSVNVASAVTNRRLKRRKKNYVLIFCLGISLWQFRSAFGNTRAEGKGERTTTRRRASGPSVSAHTHEPNAAKTFFGSSGTVHCGPPLALCFRSRFIGPLNWVCLHGVFTKFKREKRKKTLSYTRENVFFFNDGGRFFFLRY